MNSLKAVAATRKDPAPSQRRENGKVGPSAIYLLPAPPAEAARQAMRVEDREWELPMVHGDMDEEC